MDSETLTSPSPRRPIHATFHDSLFTPPPSESDLPSERPPRFVASCVLVPPLSRSKSRYRKIPSLPISSQLCLNRNDHSTPNKRKRVFEHQNNVSTNKPVDPTVIDLTLDDQSPISHPRPVSSQETPIRIGVVHSVSYRTLLFNTRLLRPTDQDIAHTSHFNLPLPPFRRRRALLDHTPHPSPCPDDEFSLGSPLVTEDDDDDEFSEFSDSPIPTSVPSPRPSPPPPPPTQVPKPFACPPRIDLAAEFRKKKNTKRSSFSTLFTPSVNALGKRKAVNPITPETFPAPDNTFDFYINYSSPSFYQSTNLSLDNNLRFMNPLSHNNPQPMILSLDNNPRSMHLSFDNNPPSMNLPLDNPPPAYAEPNAYLSTVVDPLIYPSDDYTSQDFIIAGALSDPPGSEGLFAGWSSPEADMELEMLAMAMGTGTVNPSLLSGVYPDECTSTGEVLPENESVTVSDEVEEDVIVVRHRSVEDTPKKRKRVKRAMPDMVELSLSEDDDVRSVIVSKPRVIARPPVLPKKHKAVVELPQEFKTAGPKVMVGGQFWPMQDEAVYCHQCRNKTMVLKLECVTCSKLYCVRCLTLRYPDEPRALKMNKAGCPSCFDFCNCTKCCQRRGVQYVSTKDAMAGGSSSRAKLDKRRGSKFTTTTATTAESLRLSPTRSPSLAPVFSTDGGTYWGTIYASDGSRIGAGFRFAKEDLVCSARPETPKEEEKVDNVVEPKKKRRVYVGKIQPCWGFSKAVKKTFVDPDPVTKRMNRFGRSRRYVGNRRSLFYKTREEKMGWELDLGDLSDLSPLSSLEDDWEEEDKKEEVVEKGDVVVVREESKDESLTDYDVMRAIGLSLHACGIQLAG